MKKMLSTEVRGLLFAVMAAAFPAIGADVNLTADDVLDWATQKPAAADVVKASGGKIVFSENAVVSNVFELSGAVEVEILDNASVRFARKWVKKAEGGKMICSSSITFGSDDSGLYAYLPPDSLDFTETARANGAKVTLTGYPSFTVLIDRWTKPVGYVYANNLYSTLYGENMFDVIDGVATLPANETGKLTWRMSNQNNFDANATVEVPANVTLVVRRMDFNPETGSGFSWQGRTGEFSNNLFCRDGGSVLFDAIDAVKYHGNISGHGYLTMNAVGLQRNIFGSLAGMTPDSTLTLQTQESGRTPSGANYSTRLNSDFPGKVIFKKTNPTNIVSVGFVTQSNVYTTNSYYSIGGLRGGTVFGNGDFGARLQYQAHQHFTVGTVENEVAVFSSGIAGDCALDVGCLNDAKLYIKNGVRLTIGSTIDWPELYYMSGTTFRDNTVTVADGAYINKITIPNGQKVYLNGNCEIGYVVGHGTLEITGGNVRIGASDATAKVIAREGTVLTCGGGDDVLALINEKASLWLDASDTQNMVGAWNAGWAASTADGGGAKVLQHHPAVMFNGAQTATWTNGFPLIEKWFDKRPTQRLNYGWQDRCVNYSSTLYTLVYPYLVPNGLNGRAYMSFGSHGEADLNPNVDGLADTIGVNNSKRERRRMPFMQNMKSASQPEGHAIFAETAILVYGSQQGGGRAVMGGYATVSTIDGDDQPGVSTTPNGRVDWTVAGNPICTCHFPRGGANSSFSVTNAFLKTNDYEMWVDGDSVKPKTTAPNGGWQIVAFNMNNKPVRSLGMGNNYTSAGGQNYAEILLFSSKLTTRERRSVEGYLAQKWNLPGAISMRGTVTVDAGATVKGHVSNVSGAGTWLFDSPDAAPTIGGSFGGRVGFNFTYAGGAMSPMRTLNVASGMPAGFVAIDCAEPPRTGRYPLVGGTASTVVEDWEMRVTGPGSSGRVFQTEVIDGILNLVVKSGGTVILIR